MVSSGFIARVENLLPEYLPAQRWYRAKARTIRGIAVQDVIDAGEGFSIFVLQIEYSEHDRDLYLLPLAPSNGSEASLSDASSQPGFRDLLLEAIASGKTFKGSHGDLAAFRTSAFSQTSLPVESFVSGAEQSNTSIIYRDHFILKLFRKIESGINPDLEIGRFLTEQAFPNTPALLGGLEYRTHEGAQVYSAGILQQFVKNRGDAWKYTLDSLAGFFERALSSGAFPAQPPLNLLADYPVSAELLGKRTAQMHSALASARGNPDFAPEAFTQDDAHELADSLLAQAAVTFALLREKASSLPVAAAESAREVLTLETEITGRFGQLKDTAIGAARIREHGDYHLGQVLYTGEDFMIIDFEGEPARPLSERRAKGLALRDVAGMLRSFQYAAYAALFGQVPGVRPSSENAGQIEAWSAFWNSAIAARYLQGYFQTAANAPYVPAEAEQRQLLLDVFLLQKALYEVAYELNNRPGWVRIPLRGILSLVHYRSKISV